MSILRSGQNNHTPGPVTPLAQVGLVSSLSQLYEAKPAGACPLASWLHPSHLLLKT